MSDQAFSHILSPLGSLIQAINWYNWYNVTPGAFWVSNKSFENLRNTDLTNTIYSDIHYKSKGL